MKKITLEDIALFRDAVKNVTPLTISKKRLVTKTKPKPTVRSKKVQEITYEEYPFTDHLQETVSYDEKLFFANSNIRSTQLRALRQGKLAYTATLDLHGMTIPVARSALNHFLEKCTKTKQRCVLIIHGKGRLQLEGTPKLKNQINNWLKQHPAILAFCSAQARDGGTGAVYVLLKSQSTASNY